jgi:hypothetical protein
MAKTKTKPDHIMGRPRVNIDLKLVFSLAAIQCTIAEISAVIDIPTGTLVNREDFTSTYKKGTESGKMSLRRLQFKIAKKSAAMAIFLGKQYLGQKDKVEVDPGDLFKGDIEFLEKPDKNRVKQFLNN